MSEQHLEDEDDMTGWLVTLACECGHDVTGLRTENLPCFVCLHDPDNPHRCTFSVKEDAH